jgi:hypothetical protein
MNACLIVKALKSYFDVEKEWNKIQYISSVLQIFNPDLYWGISFKVGEDVLVIFVDV